MSPFKAVFQRWQGGRMPAEWRWHRRTRFGKVATEHAGEMGPAPRRLLDGSVPAIGIAPPERATTACELAYRRTITTW